MAQTYHDYLMCTEQPLYAGKKVQIPEPELYAIYTGDRQERPSEILLSEEFFGGKECAVDVKIKMIYDGAVSKETGEGDIISQYVLFTKICNEQVKLYGRTKKAIMETIRICKDRNVLKEYLESREKEVVDIMMVLYDEEEAMRMYVKSERYDEKVETARRMIEDGDLSADKIAKYSGLTIEEVVELQKITGAHRDY